MITLKTIPIVARTGSIQRKMADFFQSGSVATLHRLGEPDVPRLERELQSFAAGRPMTLALPCHAAELGSPALENIIAQLSSVSYLGEVVVGIDGAGSDDWERAKKAFAPLPQKTTLIWIDGPRMTLLLTGLADRGFDKATVGKGRTLWLCFGAILAAGVAKIVAVHDCDVTTYNRELLARLCHPIANGTFPFSFGKGYSARYSTILHGRVMRLLFTPLIRSLRSTVGDHPFLAYLDSFRYPLAGEVCIDIDLLRELRIPSDWGVDVGLLADVFRSTSVERMCQVDLGERYDHKHQDLSPDNPQRGLSKMATDIARCIFQSLSSHGTHLDQDVFRRLLVAYGQNADRAIRAYTADAAINHLAYDGDQERLVVSTFTRCIRRAADDFRADAIGDGRLPSWNQIFAEAPTLVSAFLGALEADNDR